MVAVVDALLGIMAETSKRDRSASAAVRDAEEPIRSSLLEDLALLPQGSRGRRRTQVVVSCASSLAESPWESNVRRLLAVIGAHPSGISACQTTGLGEERGQARSISATSKAISRDCWWLRRGSTKVS